MKPGHNRAEKKGEYRSIGSSEEAGETGTDEAVKVTTAFKRNPVHQKAFPQSFSFLKSA